MNGKNDTPENEEAPADAGTSYGACRDASQAGTSEDFNIAPKTRRQGPDRYPHVPGWKGRSTSRAAAHAQRPKVKAMWARVLDCLNEAEGEPLTPEQIMDRLSTPERPLLLTSIRPRCSELARLGLIRDSGLRGRGEGGCKAIRWAVVNGSGLTGGEAAAPPAGLAGGV
jgi:hypothetical protein